MEKKTKYFTLGILGGFGIIAIVIAILMFIPLIAMVTGPSTVAVIPVVGEIGYGASSENVTIANPDVFSQMMDEANNDPNIGAIVLDINSPGGSPVAGEEMLEKVNSSQKPVVARISDTGASAAYMVASGADEIVASPSSWVGSIGVILTLSDLSEYYKKHGVDIYSITGGKYKDMGADYRNLTTDEKNMLQTMVDEQYNSFIKIVAENRNLTVDYVKKIAEGKPYTGQQALNNSLIDRLGGKDYAIELAANKSNMDYYNVLDYGTGLGFFGI
ncbi:signal peptide peptidase SppA [Methanobrevibacter arboriphilus]|uniref:signal peptide peptidase SppA n=1 Tax=Methanobrevibacter arboriphilus TaxID=39441 RepID=UPI000694249A|nr:signal peptide peptidase SppA [Methanobrevibacter arboriphilus]